MIHLKKLPKHLIEIVKKIEYEKIATFEKGVYIKNEDSLIYISESSKINPLSIQISGMDLEFLKTNFEKGYLNFIVDENTEIVDLEIKVKKKFKSDEFIRLVEKINPGVGIEGKLTNLLDSYKNLKEKILKEDYTFLTGRGLGLTPSGDDILIGIVLAFKILKDKGQIDCIKNNISLDNTNEISKSFVLYAFNDIFSESLIALLEDDNLEEVIRNIIDYGHTSGGDTILGLYLIFKANSLSQ